MKRFPLLVLWAFIFSCALLAQTDNKTEAPVKAAYDSPRLTVLAKTLATGENSLPEFWTELNGKGPLVESIDGDGQHLWVTFIWRGDHTTQKVGLFGGLPSGVDFIKPLTRLAQTDVWFRTEKLPKDARFTYMFFANYDLPKPGEEGAEEKMMKQARRDQFNPKTFLFPVNSSVIELPAAPPQPWLRRLPDIPTGNTTREKIKSEILKEDRNLSIYTPPGYEAGKSYGLLVQFDGEAVPFVLPLPAILDNLITTEKIPPLIAVAVESQKTRNRDLTCSADFADFLAKELVPWLRSHYSISNDPKQTVVSGFSFGGLAATYAGLRHPEVFGNVLSQSGSFWFFKNWTPKWDYAPFFESGWLTRQFVDTPRLPLRFYLEVGRLEQGIPVNMVVENRRMRDVLTAKGYPVTYNEYTGGHDLICWRGSLADGLIALLGKASH